MTDGGSILVVDDTLASLKLLVDTLKAQDYKVRAAQSGELALHAAALDPPELILLDIRMPGIDGYETCRRLKADPATRDIPVIFLSASGAADEKVLGFAAGAVDYVTKPFQREELLARVRTHLELRRLNHNLEREIAARTQALKTSEARFRVMVERAPEAIFLFDVDQGHIVQVNGRAEQLTGRSRAELIGSSPSLIYSAQHRPTPQTIQNNIDKALAGEEVVGERIVRHASGKSIPCEVRLVAMPTEDQRLLRASFIDISERKAAAEQLDFLAHYDPLTGLPNQVSLRERLTQLLASSAAGQQHAVVMADLDDFRYINDIRGHYFGDLLVSEVAKRLRGFVAERGFVARLGGDEFVIVFHNIAGRHAATRLADELTRCIAAPYRIQAREIRATASLGLCIYPDDANGYTELIQHCDLAMYNAKAGGKNCARIFDAQMDNALHKRLTLEAELRIALEQDQLTLHYQPQIELESGRVIGLEALVRWQHPEKGMIPPGDFIPVAEQTNLIPLIDHWVLCTACRQLKQWQDVGLRDVSVSVNLSASQFQNDGLIQSVRAILDETGINPAHLDLEITESSVMSDAESTIAVMQKLIALGVTISIDDFGTGYSSLSYLKRFPIHTLKIDRSFVKDIETDKNDALLCDIIANLAHRMDLKVIAEGVETAFQLNYLISIACDRIQGYFFSKPLPAESVIPFIRSHPTRTDASLTLF